MSSKYIPAAKKRKFSTENDTSAKNNSKKTKDPSEINARKLALCKKLLNDLRNRNEYRCFTLLFDQPVDIEENQCFDYYDVIKNPMDLSTMQGKMERGEYKTPEEFEKDMKLIISNCEVYNPPGHEILEYSNKLKRTFEIRFKRIMQPPTAKAPNQQLIEESNNFLTRSSFTIKTNLPNDKNFVVKEMTRLVDYLGTLLDKFQDIDEIEEKYDTRFEEEPITPKKKTVRRRIRQKKIVVKREKEDIDSEAEKNNAVNAEKNIAAKAEKYVSVAENNMDSDAGNSSDDEEEIDDSMSYEEKKKIVLDLNKLPNENVMEVIKMCETMEPESFTKNDSNIRVEFSLCSTKTLNQVKMYVNNYFHPKIPRAAPLPRKNKLEKQPELVPVIQNKLKEKKKDCEDKLAMVRKRLDDHYKPKVEYSDSSSSSSGSDSSSSSSSGSDSSSSSDSEDEEG